MIRDGDKLKDTQSRKWQITLNLKSKKQIDLALIKKELSEIKAVQYYCYAQEIGLKEHTPHIHIFIACSSPVRFSTIKRHFPEGHIEQARGSCEENKRYVQKSGKWEDDPKADTSIKGTFEEWGEMPVERQGARSDLDLLYQLVKDGKSNFEILEENSDYLLRLTDIERVRQTVKAEEFRTTFRNMEVTYLWGRTGTGKTRYVMEKEGYSAVYRVSEYEHPFDSYTGQETLVLDEYRSQLKISELLNLLDGYPLELRCRYANKTACFTKVWIISNLALQAQYPIIQQEQPETWKALLRRIHKIVELQPTRSGLNKSH
ncbi:replication protein [Paenibacillus sp. HJL G12]|uniref:ATP-dependent helicase Rep n=1 Tax=Paenibacillus dendrobii TaxID=2691084 RepID=A0A7X3IK16_9BACL|nr:replication protein [Paenibacillus dendrobii]